MWSPQLILVVSSNRSPRSFEKGRRPQVSAFFRFNASCRHHLRQPLRSPALTAETNRDHFPGVLSPPARSFSGPKSRHSRALTEPGLSGVASTLSLPTPYGCDLEAIQTANSKTRVNPGRSQSRLKLRKTATVPCQLHSWRTRHRDCRSVNGQGPRTIPPRISPRRIDAVGL
jgi:hypothetical protein